MAATVCGGLGRIRHTLHTATDYWSRTGHHFAGRLREGVQRYALSERDMQRIFDKEIVPEHLEAAVGGRKTSGRLVLTTVVGQPGAGKTTTVRAVAESFRGRGEAVPLIADNYVRHHPEFAALRDCDDFTTGDHLYPIAERWLDMAADYVIARRRSAVLEEGASDPMRAAQLIRRFQQNRYGSVVEAVAVSRAESEASVLARFLRERLRYGTGRYVPGTAQTACFHGSADLLRMLESDRPPVAVDALRVRTRSEVLFENHRMATGEWADPPRGWHTLQVERDRPPTADEEYAYFERAMRFREMLAQANIDAPERAADWQRLLVEMDHASMLVPG
ncbi:zeta toxin family protein [Nocardia sp. NPDC001965]